MPRADTYLASLFSGGTNKSTVRAKVLTPLEVVSLTSGLSADAADFYYSSWVSFLDAVNGLNRGFYTWATVKLYYSVFYAFRASLAADNVCTFHVDGSPFMVLAAAGQTPSSCSDRGTHKTVLKTFQRRNPGHPLMSQKIDVTDALDWVIQMRESANYGQARFQEPKCDSIFLQASINGLRRLLNAYTEDTTYAYVFDPDHAMVAFPLRALQLIGDQLVPHGLLAPSEEEQSFLRSQARDAKGALAALVTELKRLNMLY
jgi:hypothetical protein